VAVEKTGDARFAFAGEELKEGSEVLGADGFSGEGAVKEMEVREGGVGVVSGWVEGEHWTNGTGRVNEVEGGAEEAGEGVRQGHPASVSSANVSQNLTRG
jgi:hypothetical protein